MSPWEKYVSSFSTAHLETIFLTSADLRGNQPSSSQQALQYEMSQLFGPLPYALRMLPPKGHLRSFALLFAKTQELAGPLRVAVDRLGSREMGVFPVDATKPQPPKLARFRGFSPPLSSSPIPCFPSRILPMAYLIDLSESGCKRRPGQ